MRPGSARGVAAAATVLAALLISTGCDSTSFVPPPPPPSPVTSDPGFVATYEGSGDATSPPAPAAGKPEGKRQGGARRIVELILTRPADPDRDYLALSLRRELGKIPTILRMPPPGSGGSLTPKEQADAIRAAVGRGVAGLIVEPIEDPAVVDALHEAAGRGVSVLLLDRPVPARGGRAFPRVEFTSFADVGRRIVEDLLKIDENLRRADPGRVIILHHRTDDLYIERALASLLGPIKASGKPVEVIAFEETAERAIDALRKSLQADPRMDILLADDTWGLSAGDRVLIEWSKSGRREVLLGGYASYDARTPDLLEHARAFGDRSVQSYAMKVSQAIGSLLDGKAVGEVVEVPVTFHHKPMAFVPRFEKSAPPRKPAVEP